MGRVCGTQIDGERDKLVEAVAKVARMRARGHHRQRAWTGEQRRGLTEARVTQFMDLS